MMRRSTRIAIAVAVLVVSGSSIGLASANASTAPATDSQLVKPAVSNDSGQFFTSDQLGSVWTAVTSHYPQALPAGTSFPSKPTAFFNPDSDAKTVLYQAGLVDEIVANYWECSWLKAGLQAEQGGNSNQLKLADAAIASYGSLPSVSANINLADYRAATAAYAKENGITDKRQAEYELECSK